MALRTVLLGTVCISLMAPAATAMTPYSSHPTGMRVDLPDAQIGDCYQLVRIDAEYETVMQTVVVADGYEIYDVTDPRLERRTLSFVSREAGMRYRVTEPVYETVTEQVQIRPSYVRYEVDPARTETVSERILVREAQLKWVRGYVEGARQVRHDPETGEIWCLIEEPAVYETIHRTVVTHPAQIREVPIEPEYATITREVLVRPATVEEIPIPAEEGSYTVHVLTEEGQVSRSMSPQRTEQVARYELIHGERFEWRLVECQQIEIPQHPHPAPTPSRHHQSSADEQMPRSHIRSRRHVDQGDTPHGGGRDSESTPVASNTLHPGAPPRRRVD